MPSSPRSRKSAAAIHPRVFAPRVRVVSSHHGHFEPRNGCGHEEAARRAASSEYERRSISRHVERRPPHGMPSAMAYKERRARRPASPQSESEIKGPTEFDQPGVEDL